MIESKAIAIRPVLIHELLDEYNRQASHPMEIQEYIRLAGINKFSRHFDSHNAVTRCGDHEVLPAEFREFMRRYIETNKDKIVYHKSTTVEDKNGEPPRIYESFVILMRV
ncbi:MAG: hypothetical protein AABX47_02720 [Nanoarchaeota archaeon]